MKISVAMTTYNGASFLRQQLDSIFAQSRLPDEIIVCDDRSTDETPELLRQYAERSPCEMKVIVNDERLGSIKNFEKAIDLCSGDLIALCDQDDVWRQQKLSVIESAFEADSELGVVLTNADLIDEAGAPLRGDLWARCRLNGSRQELLKSSRRYDLLFGLPFATGATMAFRSRYKSLLLPMPADAPTFFHDRWIAILIAAVGRIVVIPEKLITYRLHSQQQIGLGKMLFLKILDPFRCWSDVIALEALEERLAGNSSWSASPDFLRSLSVRRQHVAARSRYSRNPVRRLVQIASEYRKGSYTLYPYGAIVCLQDLIAGTVKRAGQAKGVTCSNSSLDYAHDSETKEREDPARSLRP